MTGRRVGSAAGLYKCGGLYRPTTDATKTAMQVRMGGRGVNDYK